MMYFFMRWVVYSFLLWGGYRLFLSGGTHYRFNRLYLISMLPVAFILSAVRLPLYAAPVLKGVLLDTVIAPTALVTSPGASAPVFTILLPVYISGVLVFASLLVARLYRLRTFLKSTEPVNSGRYSISSVPASLVAGSFFNRIFLPANLATDTERIVLLHEAAHADYKHSADILYVECMKVLFYFNPVVWLLRRDLSKVHECQADRQVLMNTDAATYKTVLLESALQSSGIPYLISFSNHELKFRFYMMNKPRSGRWAAWKATLALPVVAFAAFAFSMPGSTLPELIPASLSASPQAEDVYPEYVGGQTALGDFIRKNLKYPESAIKNKTEGKVMVGFIVKSDGKVTDVVVKRGINEECDQEAVRVVKMMPDWKPGTKNGKPANFEMVLPIQFQLQ